MPLAQLAKIHHELEQGQIWRRNRLPTVTVQADIQGGMQAPVVTAQINPRFDELRAAAGGLPHRVGGATESPRRRKLDQAVVPIMLVAVVTLLMMQLQSMSRTLLVLLTAPLGLIGVAMALLVQRAFGFVANLGVVRCRA